MVILAARRGNKASIKSRPQMRSSRPPATFHHYFWSSRSACHKGRPTSRCTPLPQSAEGGEWHVSLQSGVTPEQEGRPLTPLKNTIYSGAQRSPSGQKKTPGTPEPKLQDWSDPSAEASCSTPSLIKHSAAGTPWSSSSDSLVGKPVAPLQKDLKAIAERVDSLEETQDNTRRYTI